MATFLNRLQEAERLDGQGRVPQLANGQLFGLIARGAHFLDGRSQFKAMPNRNRGLRQGQNEDYIASCTVQFAKNAIYAKIAPKKFQ